MAVSEAVPQEHPRHSEVAEHIARALREFLPDGRRITGVHRIGDGHSNDTYFVDGINAILRAAPPSGGLMPDYDIKRQYEVLDAIGQCGSDLPIPQVFGLCTDDSVIGRPFFLMTRADGGSTDWKPPQWMVDGGPELRAELSRTWIGAVGAIHELPTSCIGTTPRNAAGEAAHWLELATHSHAPAELLDILTDLAENPPRSSGPATCVHGDPKFANFLWTDNGTLTAVLDWEFAHVGEPLVDLGYLLGLWPSYGNEPGQMPYTQLDGWWTREQIISHWQAITGRTARDIDRYELLGMAQIGAIFARGVDLYRTGLNQDPRLGRWERSLEMWLANMRHRSQGSAPTHTRKDLP